MPRYGIGKLVIDKNLCLTAVGFDADLDKFGKVNTEVGEIFHFSRGIKVGEVEVGGGDAAFCAEGDPNGGVFAEEIDPAHLAGV